MLADNDLRINESANRSSEGVRLFIVAVGIAISVPHLDAARTTTTIVTPILAKKRSIAFRSPRASRSPSWCTQAQRTDGTSGGARISMKRSPARDAGATTSTHPTRKWLNKASRISSNLLAPPGRPRVANRRPRQTVLPAQLVAPDLICFQLRTGIPRRASRRPCRASAARTRDRSRASRAMTV